MFVSLWNPSLLESLVYHTPLSVIWERLSLWFPISTDLSIVALKADVASMT